MPAATPFTIAIEQERLDDLSVRLRRAHLATDYANEHWQYGTNGAYLRELIDYWISGFDWRKQEAAINRLSHFRVILHGIPVHFAIEKGVGTDPLPLVLTHGWPWTFWDFKQVIGPLADPAAFGGDPADAFDVVVPSLPGYIFSTPLLVPGVNWWKTADLWASLMQDVLGYERFGAHGSDWGAAVTLQLGHKYPDRVAGVHTTVAAPLTIFGGERPWDFAGESLHNLEDEASRTELIDYDRKIAAHVAVHVLSPQTIGYALQDSPAGLCAWLVERRRAWSDCDGDIETVYSKDELLTHVSLYWLTDCFASSVRYYHEAAADPWRPSHDLLPTVRVPAGFTLFERDAPVPTIGYLKDAYDLRFHHVSGRGGHFAAAEQPETIVNDLRAMFRPLR
jgi:pimeloyl-ACP methyl ester carboxylesterase